MEGGEVVEGLVDGEPKEVQVVDEREGQGPQQEATMA